MRHLLSTKLGAAVLAIGLLAAVGIFRRLPSYLWTVGCAIAVGGLTAVAVLRFEMLAALATLTAQMHLVQDFQVRGEPLAGRTTAALVAFLVTAAVAAHPLLREPAVAGEPHEHDLPRPVLR